MSTESKTQPTILFVEDDNEIREDMKRLLQTKGYRVIVALNEQESVDLVTKDELPVGLILVNQRMISDDALAAGRRIRLRGKISTAVPVVVIPFEFTVEMEGTDQRAGGSDYKTYMTSNEQLEKLLGRLLPP